MSTIILVGSGTSATGNNASVTPTFHASTTVGDFVLIASSIRNSGTGVPVLPAGWTDLTLFGNVRIFARIFQAGDTPPLCTFTGGAAGDDTIAQCVTWRGVSAENLATLTASVTQLNATATTIAYPLLTVPKDRCLVLLAAWRQADSPSISGPAGYTFNASTTTTVGNDASQGIRSIIQTTATNLAASSLTTGSAISAISRVIGLVLKPAATLTVTPQVVYPPRTLVSVADLTLGDAVTLYRVVSGLRTVLRGGYTASATDPSFVVVDAELPFGVPVSYVASVNGVEYTSAGVTYALPGGQVALSDAVSGQSAAVTIMAFPERAFDRENSVFSLSDRKVVTLGDLTGFTGDIELYSGTTSNRDNLFGTVNVATQGILQIRQAGGYDGIDCYVAVLSAREQRFSQDGTDERRRVTLMVVEVAPWASTLLAQGFTLQDIADAYTGLTLADLSGNYATLLLVALADWS